MKVQMNGGTANALACAMERCLDKGKHNVRWGTSRKHSVMWCSSTPLQTRALPTPTEQCANHVHGPVAVLDRGSTPADFFRSPETLPAIAQSCLASVCRPSEPMALGL